jgi:hypothetical protein
LFEVGSAHFTSTYLFNDFELFPNEFMKHKSVMVFSISFKIWMQLANAKFILLCTEQTKKQSYALNVSNDSPVSHIKEWKLEDLSLAFIHCHYFICTSILLALLIEKRLCIGVSWGKRKNLGMFHLHMHNSNMK